MEVRPVPCSERGQVGEVRCVRGTETGRELCSRVSKHGIRCPGRLCDWRERVLFWSSTGFGFCGWLWGLFVRSHICSSAEAARKMKKPPSHPHVRLFVSSQQPATK